MQVLGLIILSLLNLTSSQGIFSTYINQISSWNSPLQILQDLGCPKYSKNDYTHFLLAFWTSDKGPVDIALLWQQADKYFGQEFGNNKQDKQKNIKKIYNDQGKKLMVSAFGSTDMPSSRDASIVCSALAQFVLDNNLDGVDLDFEDNAAMEIGTGEQWLITCTKKIREMLPSPKFVVTHAPQGPYFMGQEKYPQGGYQRVDQEVGDLIDFYNIQFYNQETTSYDSYETLFVESNGWATGTSVNQLIQKGINKDKIVVGKPVKQSDAYNSGWVNSSDLNTWAKKAKEQFNWEAGYMTWQFSQDDGTFMKTAKF